MSEVSFTSWIQELKSRADIVTIIGEYINLERKGTNYLARCPFHNEKTPSFTVSSSKQIYKCFGCNVGGDVINFVQDIEHISFMEAIEKIANKVGMQMIETNKTSKSIQERGHKKKLLQIVLDTANYYKDNLTLIKNNIASKYLKKRQLDENSIKRYGMGYSIDEKTLIKYLKSKGHADQDIIDSGVAQKSSKGIIDSLSGRLIVPIINSTREVIAFGGRLLEENTEGAKYKNTRETLLYVKRNQLFGINLLAKTLREEKKDFIILVEGYMDVISLFQYGVKNVVASMGTSFTVEQARIIKRYSNNLYICYDGDTAGKKGALKALDILEEQEINVKIVNLPNKDDPDDYIRKNGIEKYNDLLVHALSATEYRLELLASKHDLENGDGRIAYARECIDLLKSRRVEHVPSYFYYITKKTYLDDTVLEEMLKKSSVKTQSKKSIRSSARDELIRYYLYSLFSDHKSINEVGDFKSYITNIDQLAVYNSYVLCKEEKQHIALDMLEDMSVDNVEAQRILQSPASMSPPGIRVKYLKDALDKLILYDRNHLLESLAHQYDIETDLEKKAEIAVEIEKISRIDEGEINEK